MGRATQRKAGDGVVAADGVSSGSATGRETTQPGYEITPGLRSWVKRGGNRLGSIPPSGPRGGGKKKKERAGRGRGPRGFGKLKLFFLFS
jgi:hypothetical protein